MASSATPAFSIGSRPIGAAVFQAARSGPSDRKSCAAKAAIVARDEFERGDRALLNLGHTFGHALERVDHYDGARLVHGEGVAIGMAVAFRFSARARALPGGGRRARRGASARGRPADTDRRHRRPGTSAPTTIVEAMRQDKKVERGALTFILAHGIGDCFVAKSRFRPRRRARSSKTELNTGN